MIPSEDACSSAKAATMSAETASIRGLPEAHGTEKTAWQRYRELVALIEAQGGKLNRKSMLDSIFRGNDLVYVAPRNRRNVYRNPGDWPRNCSEPDNKAAC